MPFKVREPIIHVLGWVVCFSIVYLGQLMQFPFMSYYDGSMLLMLLGGTLWHVTAFYASAMRWCPQWREFGPKHRATLEVLLFVLLSIPYKSAILLGLAEWFHPGEILKAGTFSVLPFIHMFMTSIFVVLGITYRLWKDQVENDLVRKQLELGRVSSELAYLKMQVNPHFLFNTLNNLYGLASREGAENTGESILKLADLMRYMLHEVNEETVPLDRELECLRSYIDLQRLRISDRHDVKILLEIDGNTEGLMVPPMMLIPLVENAFKYGISFKNRSEILMHFEVSAKEVIFRVENTVNRKDEELEGESGGIGLGNQRRRLALLYQGADRLACVEENGRYRAMLTLPRKGHDLQPDLALAKEVTA